MTMDQVYCDGRYKVETVAFEMRMSHWVEAPYVTRVADGGVVLDLSSELWDLSDVHEDGDVLVLILRKYPGTTNDVTIRILPASDQFVIDGRIVNRQELKRAMDAYP